MPVLSCFTSFGFLEFSSAPSECERVYRSLISSYRDPVTGKDTFDVSIGTHKEAVIFGWANAIAAARVYVRRAAAELRAETAYSLLESQEKRFGMTPGAEDTVVQRQAALAAKQKAPRGPRYEAVWEALNAILGTDLVAYRPINISEAEAWPPALEDSAGIFRRPDVISKSVRLLDAVTRTGEALQISDEYDQANQDSVINLSNTTELAAISAISQSFAGNGGYLSVARFFLKKTGTPPGTATAKLYALDPAIAFGGGNDVPYGTVLATSEPFTVSALTGSYVLTDFTFSGAERVLLDADTYYAIVLEYTAGVDGVHTVDVGVQSPIAVHSGNAASYSAGAWTAASSMDVIFDVLTGYAFKVSYENWNRSLVEEVIVAGDILCIDPGNLGLVERVTVLSAEGSGTSRTFTAIFEKPHSAGTYGTTGPVPLWSNSKRHVLVVVKAAAAIAEDTVIRINQLFQRMMRGTTTWAIVQPTTPGAATIGPFVIGTALGSPLGAVPLESIPVVPSSSPFILALSSPTTTTGGGVPIRLHGDNFSDVTDVKVDGVSVPFTLVSRWVLTFTPVSHIAGVVDVAVTNGTGTTTEAGALTFVQAALTLSSITPATGPAAGGTAIVAIGTGFYAATNVTIGGFSLAVWAIVDDNTITATSDAAGGPGVTVLRVTDGVTNTEQTWTFT